MIIGLLLFLLFGINHLVHDIDVYYEFLFIYIITFNLYYVVYYLLNRYISSFTNINPEHKKMYVIKNYMKSFYLASLCLTLRYFFYGEYDIYFIKRCAIYYIINDMIGLLLVDKLPTTTIIHHSTTSLCGLIILTKDNNNLDILTLIVLYGIFSSLSFSVNFYLGYRVHSTNNLHKYYLSTIANSVYIISCLINWLIQLYLFYGIFSLIPIYHTIIYLAFIYSVVSDDIILIKWLYNDMYHYKKIVN